MVEVEKKESNEDEKNRRLKERLSIIRNEKTFYNYVFKMSRIPKQTIKDFNKISEDFCDDYGLSFKMLVDFYKDFDKKNVVYESMNRRIAILEQLVGTIYKEQHETEPKVSKREQQGMKVVERQEEGDGKDE